jgi:hypothetical protein
MRKDKNVSQIVEKYKRQYPNLDRDLVRKLIRLENPNLNLRTVDRYLKKAFLNHGNIQQNSQPQEDWLFEEAKKMDQVSPGYLHEFLESRRRIEKKREC